MERSTQDGATDTAVNALVMDEVAHDLKRPLHGIAMAVDLIGRKMEAGAYGSVGPLLELIRAEALQLNRLIGDLLDAARMEDGAFRIQATPVAPSSLVDSVLESFDAAANAAGVTLTSESSEFLPAIAVDRERVLQVLSNLVDNAIRYTPRGGQVRVSAESHGDAVRFSVRDTGAGIEAADRERIFRPYERGARARGTGAGLGLSIAKRIIEAHGGGLGVESEEGRGSTFWFELRVVYGHE